MHDSLTDIQIRKGVAITVGFIVMRLIVAQLWNSWFDGEYHLSAPFLLFLLGVFLVMSVGLVYFGFSKWVGVSLKAWWYRRERILGDVIWGVGVIISAWVLLIAVGLVMWVFDFMPPSLANQESTPLAQLPVTLVLGWFFGYAIASFEEETIFRGFLQEVIGRKHGGWVSNLLQAAVFSASHLGMEPLQSIGNVAFLLLFRFGFGVLMGWLRMRRGTLLAAGIVHGFIG